MSKSHFTDEQIREIVRESEAGLETVELCLKHAIDEETLRDWKEKYSSRPSDEQRMRKLEEENRNLKLVIGDLMLERRSLLHQNHTQDPQSPVPLPSARDSEQELGNVLHPKQSSSDAYARVSEKPSALGRHFVEMGADLMSGSHKDVRFLLERSRIIPAIRNADYLDAAMASPALIVSLLFGTPLTIGEVVRKLRSASKLPIANLDLLTGFAQDSDAVKLLVELGVAGVVSTRQSVLRTARAQGIIAVQRTFIVDSIAIGNITRSLQHFVPHAMELLPAVAAPLAVPALRAALPQLPVIGTGLVTNMRQVEDLVLHSVTSVATSDSSLWIL